MATSHTNKITFAAFCGALLLAALPAGATLGETISVQGDAVAGDPMAQFITGRKNLIDAATTGRSDLASEGIAYLQRSAALGMTPALRQLGDYYTGLGPAQRDRGMRWYREAAEAGDPASQRRVADAHLTGDGAKRDPQQAAAWYRRLLENPVANYEIDRLWEVEMALARILADEHAGMPDPEQARALWKHAATAAHASRAMFRLAEAYATGLGGPKDIDKAVQFYAAAARDGFEHGYRYGLSADKIRAQAQESLVAMEALAPHHHLTRELRDRLEEMKAEK